MIQFFSFTKPWNLLPIISTKAPKDSILTMFPRYQKGERLRNGVTKSNIARNGVCQLSASNLTREGDSIPHLLTFVNRTLCKHLTRAATLSASIGVSITSIVVAHRRCISVAASISPLTSVDLISSIIAWWPSWFLSVLYHFTDSRIASFPTSAPVVVPFWLIVDWFFVCTSTSASASAATWAPPVISVHTGGS